jgi:hypothetical protein
VIGDTLRSRTHRRHVTEVTIAANALNRRLELGRPRHVRINTVALAMYLRFVHAVSYRR